MCWLVAQQPEHFTDTEMGMSLVAQMRTKIIFPDANLNEDGLRKMEISEPAIRMLKTDMTMGNARRFLLWRPEPVIVRVRSDRTAAASDPVRPRRAPSC